MGFTLLNGKLELLAAFKEIKSKRKQCTLPKTCGRDNKSIVNTVAPYWSGWKGVADVTCRFVSEEISEEISPYIFWAQRSLTKLGSQYTLCESNTCRATGGKQLLLYSLELLTLKHTHRNNKISWCVFISHWYTVLHYDSFAVTVCLFWLKKHIHYKLFFSDAYKFLEKTNSVAWHFLCSCQTKGADCFHSFSFCIY